MRSTPTIADVQLLADGSIFGDVATSPSGEKGGSVRMSGRVILTFLLGIACLVIGTQAENWIPADSPHRAGILATTAEFKEVGVLAIAILIGTTLVLEKGIKEGLAPSLSRGIKQGMDDATEKVISRFPSALSALLKPKETKTASERKLAESENLAPGLVSLAQEGKSQEAMEILAAQTNQPSEEQIIAVLIMSPKTEDHEQAATRLETQLRSEPKFYLRLAYRFWEDGKLNRAIDLAEKGLHVLDSDRTNKGEQGLRLAAKMKNSLAYYYAEAGNDAKRDVAYRYVYESIEALPDASEFVDTLGCVKIAFGATKDQINSGIGACFRSAAVDHDYVHFSKWLNQAIKRMEAL
jgi:hypothetical protein